MRQHTRSIILVILCTICTAIAQVFYKLGAQRLPELLTNWPILAGVGLFGIGAIFLIKGLQGGDLSLLYPILATGYIFVTILGITIFNEPFTYLKILGVISIILGITLLSKTTTHTSEAAHGN